jgi:hypothetical protein
MISFTSPQRKQGYESPLLALKLMVLAGSCHICAFLAARAFFAFFVEDRRCKCIFAYIESFL